MSLLRFVEPFKGKIIIDGIDITTVGTHDLRSRVTSLRKTKLRSSGQCVPVQSRSIRRTYRCRVLRCTRPLRLITEITSNSQKHSRAPSRASSVHGSPLESAAPSILGSIDKATDVKIQEAIRKKFHGSLLLTIAHRLETIIDFGRVIVLDKGRIVEFDTPLKLIQKENGIFWEMCIQSGSFKELEARRLILENKCHYPEFDIPIPILLLRALVFAALMNATM